MTIFCSSTRYDKISVAMRSDVFETLLRMTTAMIQREIDEDFTAADLEDFISLNLFAHYCMRLKLLYKIYYCTNDVIDLLPHIAELILTFEQCRAADEGNYFHLAFKNSLVTIFEFLEAHEDENVSLAFVCSLLPQESLTDMMKTEEDTPRPLTLHIFNQYTEFLQLGYNLYIEWCSKRSIERRFCFHANLNLNMH